MVGPQDHAAGGIGWSTYRGMLSESAFITSREGNTGHVQMLFLAIEPSIIPGGPKTVAASVTEISKLEWQCGQSAGLLIWG